MDFNKITKDQLTEIDIPNNTKEIYEIKLNELNKNNSIGYCLILDDKINEIYIFIKKEYRSHGYGKEAFKYILTNFKFRKELTFKVNLDNPIAIRMLTKSGGYISTNNNNHSTIILPIK